MTGRTGTLRIGLTGGIASGKSSAAALFAARGAPIIDTDLVARFVVRPGSDGLAAVFETFGAEARAPDGTLDRAALARRIFSDSGERQRLEEILHPRIRSEIRNRLRCVDAPYVVVVVPLLVETGMDADVDWVVVVDLDPAAQRLRLQHREGLSSAETASRLAAQASRVQRLARADFTLDNRGNPHELVGQVASLHRHFLARQCDAPPGRRRRGRSR